MATERVLAIIGSGETAPTMTSVHAELFERAGAPGARREMRLELRALVLRHLAVDVVRESIGPLMIGHGILPCARPRGPRAEVFSQHHPRAVQLGLRRPR